MDPSRDLVPLAAAMAASAALWVHFRVDTGIALEDALITYRYAENLALGEGFAFNPGEPVLGTTTPLFTMMLAAAGRVFGVQHIPAASTALSVVFGQLAGLLTFEGLRRLGLPALAATAAAALFLFQPDVASAATGGMETMLVVALMAAGFYALATARAYTAVLLCALLVMARIDGLLWAGVVLLLLCRKQPRATLRYGLLFGVALAPWTLFALCYFGNPLPHSMLAKLAISDAAESHTVASYLRWYLGASGVQVARLGRGMDSALALAVTTALALGGAASIYLKRDRPALLAVALFPFLLGIVYYLGRTPKIFPWYLVPPLWCTTVLVAVGAARLVGAIRDRLAAPGPRRLALAACTVVLALIPYHLATAGVREHRHQWQYQQYEDKLRRHLGLWLAAHTPDTASVATEAIGYLGYYSKRRIIDLAGLTSPAVVAAWREKRGSAADAFEKILVTTQPDYIVLRSFEVDRNHTFRGGPLFRTRAQRASFYATYEEARRFCAEGFSGPLSCLTVFARRDRAGGAGPPDGPERE